MRVVISGYIGYGNTGDEAVLAGLLASLRRETDELHATALSGDPAETARIHGIDAVRRADPVAIVRALRSADGLISGGGSLLQDRTSARPVAYYTGVMQLARLLGRPYAVHAQGLGPIGRAANRTLAALALRGAAHVSLRDAASVELARHLGVRRRIDLVPDPALALDIPAGERRDRIVVAVRDWGDRRGYLAEVRTALVELARDHPVLALPMQETVDREASLAVVEGVPGAEVLASRATFAERIAAFGDAAVVIGMRLHALILAAAAGVPALAVSYDPKVDAFAAAAGQPVVGGVDAPIDPGHITTAARELVAADLAPYLERIAVMRASLSEAAAATVAALSPATGTKER